MSWTGHIFYVQHFTLYIQTFFLNDVVLILWNQGGFTNIYRHRLPLLPWSCPQHTNPNLLEYPSCPYLPCHSFPPPIAMRGGINSAAWVSSGTRVQQGQLRKRGITERLGSRVGLRGGWHGQPSRVPWSGGAIFPKAGSVGLDRTRSGTGGSPCLVLHRVGHGLCCVGRLKESVLGEEAGAGQLIVWADTRSGENLWDQWAQRNKTFFMAWPLKLLLLDYAFLDDLVY